MYIWSTFLGKFPSSIDGDGKVMVNSIQDNYFVPEIDTDITKEDTKNAIFRNVDKSIFFLSVLLYKISIDGDMNTWNPWTYPNNLYKVPVNTFQGRNNNYPEAQQQELIQQGATEDAFATEFVNNAEDDDYFNSFDDDTRWGTTEEGSTQDALGNHPSVDGPEFSLVAVTSLAAIDLGIEYGKKTETDD